MDNKIFTLQTNGDILEKQAAEFVSLHIPYYEMIWQTYIGNQGNELKAEIKGYPDNDKRQRFWEHCYTVLESTYMAYTIIRNGVLMEPLTSFNDYVKFNKDYIAFFAHIGRMNDNIIRAGTVLGVDNKNLKNKLDVFYEARHIVIHGKVVPFSQDEVGVMKIPSFMTSPSINYGWTDKDLLWQGGFEIEQNYTIDTCERKLLFPLLKLLNEMFALYYEIITEELKRLKLTIDFTYRKLPVQHIITASNSSIPHHFDENQAHEYLYDKIRKLKNKEKPDSKPRSLFLFGAGAVLDWGGPKTICNGDKLTFLTDHDNPAITTNRVCCLTHLLRETGYKMKTGEHIADTVFKYLEAQGIKGKDLNFETVINFAEELFNHFSFTLNDPTPSLYANSKLDEKIMALFNFEISGYNEKTEKYNFSIPGYEFQKEDFVSQNISPYQKFCEFLISEMLSGIIGHVSNYSYFSPGHNVIYNDANAAVNANFCKWMQGFIDKGKSVRMYTLNYDRIFRNLLVEKNIDVFDGFAINGKHVDYAEYAPPDPQRIVSDVTANVFYNLHGCAQWVIEEINTNQLPGYQFFLSAGFTIDQNSAILQVEKGHKILLSKIISGYQKAQKTFASPFREMMSAFGRDCLEAEEIYIIGYSFADEHINDIIRNARKFNTKAKITLINPLFDSDQFMFDFISHWGQFTQYIYKEDGNDLVAHQFGVRIIQKKFGEYLASITT